MKQYEIELNGRQYAVLEKMLSYDNAQRLAMNQSINGYEFFSDMLDEIYSPVEDGWCTLQTLLDEPDEKLNLLRYITAFVFPEDEDYFVKQLEKNVKCPKNFEIMISLNF